MMADSLDGVLDLGLPSGRKALQFLKRAYSAGVDNMVNHYITDKILAESGHSFQIGSSDPHMRKIASWLLSEHLERVEYLIPRLWKRNGREDMKLVGLLIANIEGDPWGRLLKLLRKTETMEVVLEIAEEIKRGGRNIPSAEYLLSWTNSKITHQAVMLIASLSMKPELRELVTAAPGGGELFERIRSRALQG